MDTIADKSRTKEIIERLQTIMDGASPVPLASGKVMIYKDEVQSLLTELATQIDMEIKTYHEVNDRRGKIINEAKKEAEKIIYQAEHTASRMRVNRRTTNVDPVDFSMLTQDELNELDNANEIYGASLIYTDEMLTEVSNLITETYQNMKNDYEIIISAMEEKIQTLAENRKELMDGLSEMDAKDRSQQILEIGQLLSNELFNARVNGRRNPDMYDDGSMQLSLDLKTEQEIKVQEAEAAARQANANALEAEAAAKEAEAVAKEAEANAKEAEEALIEMTAERDKLKALMDKLKAEKTKESTVAVNKKDKEEKSDREKKSDKEEKQAAPSKEDESAIVENKEKTGSVVKAEFGVEKEDDEENRQLEFSFEDKESKAAEDDKTNTPADKKLNVTTDEKVNVPSDEKESASAEEEDDEEYEIIYVTEDELEEGEEYEIEYVDDEEFEEIESGINDKDTSEKVKEDKSEPDVNLEKKSVDDAFGGVPMIPHFTKSEKIASVPSEKVAKMASAMTTDKKYSGLISRAVAEREKAEAEAAVTVEKDDFEITEF